uniref:Uncharacterized protein n=1 Tax=viral metagenome TaxID=1070528 RepID=A0A6C0C8R9_9ZZZZ
MSSNVGHAIQRMINSTPVTASVNAQTTSVVTNGGRVYQSGLIHNKIQPSFQEVVPNPDIVGHVIDSQSTDNFVYFLSANGYVFEYDYNAGSCSPTVREVYTPAACCGDKAIRIRAGSNHIVILTECHKIWGVGDNSEYQLVPQGQCKYDSAVEIIVTNTNLHDNSSCCKFSGNLHDMNKPVIPKKSCDTVSCIQKRNACKPAGCLLIHSGETGSTETIVARVPVWGEYSYVGFLCVDKCGVATGSVTVTLENLFVKCGCLKETCCGDDDLQSSYKLFLTTGNPVSFTVPVHGDCGCDFIITNIGDDFSIPNASIDGIAIRLSLESSYTLISSCDRSFTSAGQVEFEPAICVPLDCCVQNECKKNICDEACLPQPCWVSVYAGSNITVLADDCNRLYVLGSLHWVRNNASLLKRSCLEELLNTSHATISLPADQLNCCLEKNNENCVCPKKSCYKPFCTDLSKFGVSLNFPGCEPGCCNDNCDKPQNVCDFLKALKDCNDAPTCDNTCEPCDSYIYIDIGDVCNRDRCCEQPIIKSITLYNRKSVCKAVSQHCGEVQCVAVDCNSVVEFDSNKYCIDGHDYCLDKILKLKFCVEEGEHIKLFVDLDNPGGIAFETNCDKCNVEFPLDVSSECEQFLLNYGSILDPVELTNLKYLLVCESIFPCPRFLNPFRTRIVNTYLKGGDHVCFVKPHGCNVRQAITPDVPTVFRLNRRVLDVGVGQNNLSVLVGGLACPNEIYAIGENCHGELGINSYVSQVCFKQVNRCLFDCQVVSVWSDKWVTMYITQSGRVYSTGKWKCLANSTVPRWVQSVCPSWRIKEINISQTHIVFVSTDGLIFGLGDNSIGNLGLCHIQCVPDVTCLSFFNKLSQDCFSECRDQLLHPVRRGYVAKLAEKEYYHNDECGPCNPCDSSPCFKKCPVEPIPVVRYFKKQGCGPRFLANQRLCNGGRCSK